MAASSDDGGGAQSGGDGQVWDGYSDYRTVSSRIGNLIFDAIEAYARIHAIHTEGAAIQPELAANARARIKAASMALHAELSHERHRTPIEEILNRWEDGEESEDIEVSVPSTGFIAAFREIRLYDEDPPWLAQFVTDLWRAGWELGYLKAGRHEDDGPRELEPRDVSELLER